MVVKPCNQQEAFARSYPLGCFDAGHVWPRALQQAIFFRELFEYSGSSPLCEKELGGDVLVRGCLGSLKNDGESFQAFRFGGTAYRSKEECIVSDEPKRPGPAQSTEVRLLQLEQAVREIKADLRRSRAEQMAEWDAMLKSATQIIEHHVTTVIDAKTSVFHAELREASADLKAVREQGEQARIYRMERDLREQIAKEKAAEISQSLILQKGAVEIEVMRAEPKFKHQNAVFGFIVALVTIVAGLIGAAIGSHK